MSQERSAEFCLGALCVAENNRLTATAGYYRKELAAAEAREAGERKQSADDRLEEAIRCIYAKYGPRLDLFFADAEKARETGKLTKDEWIERYSGQAVLDRDGFDVVPCVDCDDSICHGWKVVPREAAQPNAAEVIAACEKALDLLAEDIEGSLSQESFDAREEALAIIARWKEADHAK